MAGPLNQELINKIKRIVITSLVSDDELMETLVLKGGNAISMGYGLEDRASYDLDYSIEEDFPDRDQVAARIEKLLIEGFATQGYVCFDYVFTDKPKTQTQNLDFWGGYNVIFKLIEEDKLKAIGGDLKVAAARHAIKLTENGSPKISIDISKFEYVGDHKRQMKLDEMEYYVYAPELIVAEKVRALCQKLPEYTTEILQQKAPNHEKARARDFYDIYVVTQYAQFDATSPEFIVILKQVFDAKRVPHSYLRRVRSMKEIHRQDFDSLKDTIKDKEAQEKGFEFYFDYVMNMFEHLLD